ncbi:MAG TPA: TetR/AcrR family transcriptional regulator [Pseudonocardiaceae bacterium]|nr:TetR/AcrR family transcriptional regulator [Pseudonocardiaceae bacterium]
MTEETIAPSLGEAQRDLARARILRAAGQVLATRGLTATMDDVAEVAGVNRRTVFRHYATRDGLFAQAILAGVHRYGQQLPTAPEHGDLRAWLRELLVVTHRLNADNGRVFWEIAALPIDGLSAELAQAAHESRKARNSFAVKVTGRLWQASGSGKPPRWLVDAVAVQLSGFTTQSLSGDLGRSPEEVADVAARVIEAAVDAARRSR